jgi:hypothetical protein
LAGTIEKAWNSMFLSGPALWVGQVLSTGVTGNIATTIVGFGDGASFGLTGIVRGFIPGAECTVHKDGFYYGGTIAGTIASTVASGGAATGARAAAGATEDISTVVFSRSAAPGLARNFDKAVADGAPTSLNRVSAAARDVNRRAALRGQEPPPAGMSLDEYPFACSAQGGAGACVSAVPVWEQSYQGGVLSSFFQKFGVDVGDPFRVLFGP